MTFAGTNGANSNLHLGSGVVWLKDSNRQIAVTNSATTLTIGDVIQNDDTSGRALTKAGAGTLSLSGSSANTYDGTTTTVSSGGTIGGSGTVGALSISDGHLNPSNSAVTLNIVTVSLANLSLLNFELNPANNAVGGGINDLVNITGALTLDGTLNVTDGDFASVANGTAWRLFNYTGLFTDNGLAFGSMPTLGSGLTWEISRSTPNQVNLVVIPEPSAALLGGLGLLLLIRRRRNS